MTTLLENDGLTQLAFSMAENKGIYAVLLGSGLSRAAEIPTGWEITVDLIRRVGTAKGVAAQEDWDKWYRETTGVAPNYSVLLADIASTPAERRAILHGYIEPTTEDREHGRKLPTAAHRAIAKLVAAGYIRVIITTNFDRLMESALRDEGVEPTVVAAVDALAGAEPLTHSKCYLLKLHGDYKDERILNTDEELRSYTPAFDTLLDRILDEHGLIVSGWSGEWDHALRAAFVRAPSRRYPTFWSSRGAPGAGASELISHRRARLLQISNADEFFGNLQKRVEVLEATRKENPDSVDLLVAATKRYLSKPEYRIELDDLMARECEKLVAKLEAANLPDGGAFTDEEFRQRVSIYESLSEGLSRMAGVMGRWGAGSDLAIVTAIIHMLYRRAEKVQGGLVIWLGLRSYPAVLVFTAYALGLVRAERWQELHQLLSYRLGRDGREPVSVVASLFTQAWKGSESNLFKRLEGLHQRRTPLSDHLFDLMQAWKRSFDTIDPNFDLTFDRFELLAALAFCDKYSVAELEAFEQHDVPDYRIAPMPNGRFSWHGDTRTVLVEDLKNPEVAGTLLEAGFRRRSARFIELFVLQVERRASRWYF